VHAWAGIAIAQSALIAFSLWRLSRVEGRTVWWPGVAMFIVAGLALVVLVRGERHWSAIALFGTAVLASDAVFLKGVLVASLCTRESEPPPA
jgi:hypothetical protein